ncbi:unnamed protein product [Gongylonema pulchrum]|uniref:Transmembrane protein n=1 Tax=Gongylonema pulchrum TaxID=637853 RepID=A0A183DZJ5_9BILA|nr:unnamed protein product [Gongylonema pulchrum]
MVHRADPDWWIYAPTYALGAVLCLLQAPGSIIWRAASALVILFGSALIAFLIWTMHHVAAAVTDDPFDEGRNVLLLACAVAMTSGVRLRTAHYQRSVAYVRTALLLLAMVVAVAGIAYSLCFYTNALPYCSIRF